MFPDTVPIIKFYWEEDGQAQSYLQIGTNFLSKWNLDNVKHGKPMENAVHKRIL